MSAACGASPAGPPGSTSSETGAGGMTRVAPPAASVAKVLNRDDPPTRPGLVPGSFEECVEKARDGVLDGPGGRAKVTPADIERYRTARLTEQSGDVEKARRAYFDFIKASPQSSLVPHAYFSFGVLFLREAETDPSKLSFAEQAFVETLKYPPPDNGASALASLRIGEVKVLQNEYEKALASFVKANDVGKSSDDPCQKAFAAKARDGIVNAYFQTGRPERAFGFFKRVEDASAPGASAFDLQAALLDRYTTLGKASEAVALVADSLGRTPPAAFCSLAAKVIDQIKGGADDPGVRRSASKVAGDLSRTCKPASP